MQEREQELEAGPSTWGEMRGSHGANHLAFLQMNIVSN